MSSQTRTDRTKSAKNNQSTEKWEKFKDNTEKGIENALDVAKDSVESIGEDLKNSAEAFGKDVQKFTEGFQASLNSSDVEISKGKKKAKSKKQNIFDEFRANLTGADQRKKIQAWVILIGIIIIICSIIFAILN